MRIGANHFRAARGFVVPSLWLALGSLGAGLAAGVVATRVYYEGVLARAERDALQEDARQREAADLVAESERLSARAYEAWKAAQQQRAAAAARSVNRELDKHPDWARSPIPAGVRDELERAAAAAGAGEPDGAVPGTAAAPAADERGPR